MIRNNVYRSVVLRTMLAEKLGRAIVLSLPTEIFWASAAFSGGSGRSAFFCMETMPFKIMIKMDKLSLMPTYHFFQICRVMPKLAHKSPFRQELRRLPADHRDVNDRKKNT
jgi:hypothetical protein